MNTTLTATQAPSETGMPLIRIAFWNAVLFWGVPGMQTLFMSFYAGQRYVLLLMVNLLVLALILIPLTVGWRLSKAIGVSRKNVAFAIGIGMLLCLHVMWTVRWVFYYGRSQVAM
jgi:uncharacterized membrane protein